MLNGYRSKQLKQRFVTHRIAASGNATIAAQTCWFAVPCREFQQIVDPRRSEGRRVRNRYVPNLRSVRYESTSSGTVRKTAADQTHAAIIMNYCINKSIVRQCGDDALACRMKNDESSRAEPDKIIFRCLFQTFLRRDNGHTQNRTLPIIRVLFCLDFCTRVKSTFSMSVD